MDRTDKKFKKEVESREQTNRDALQQRRSANKMTRIIKERSKTKLNMNKQKEINAQLIRNKKK